MNTQAHYWELDPPPYNQEVIAWRIGETPNMGQRIIPSKLHPEINAFDYWREVAVSAAPQPPKPSNSTGLDEAAS